MNGEDENQPMGSSQGLPVKKRFSSEHNKNEQETEPHLSKKARLEGTVISYYVKKNNPC